MDNQKSQTGSGSNFNKDSSGSMGKDLQKDSGNNQSSNAGSSNMGKDLQKDSGNNQSSNTGSSNPSKDLAKDLYKDAGNSQNSTAGNVGSSNQSGNKQLDTHKADQSRTEFPKTPGLATAPSSDSSKSASLAGTASDAHKTIDKALDAAQPMADRLATTAHASVDKLSGALTDASARMEDKTKQLSEAYQHFADTGREYVRSSPATSILVALAAGYTLSKLLGRR